MFIARNLKFGKNKVLRQHPYSTFVKGKGLLDLEKYARLKTLAKAQ
jgi:RNA-directed DNA polymerase